MPYIQKEKNGTYTIKFYDYVDGKRVQRAKRGNATKKEANAYYMKYMTDKDKGICQIEDKKPQKQNTTPPPSAITLEDCFAEYTAYIKETLKTSSIKSATDVFKLHVLPYFQNKTIAEITIKDIVKWKQKINAKNFKWKYKSKIYCSFTSVINFSKKNYGIKENVVSTVGNFKNKELKKEMLFWTKEEFEQFIAVVDDAMFKTLFSFLYLSGCRKGEALALNWGDIDFSNKTVSIKKTLNRKGISDDMDYEITTPKTRAGNRVILLPDGLISLLSDFKQLCRQVDGFSANSFIFGVTKPLIEQTVRRRFNAYIEKANVKQIRIHDLRHSHASLLISQGADILIVSQRLGHSDVSETLNTYSHMFPNKQKALMNHLDMKL